MLGLLSVLQDICLLFLTISTLTNKDNKTIRLFKVISSIILLFIFTYNFITAFNNVYYY